MARLIVVFACMSLLAGIPCWAAIITVDPNGSADYTTIQAGIDAAVSGADTVVVAEGTYIENISFGGKNIILTSTDPDDPNVVADTIIDGGGLESAVTFDGTETSNCKLSGFTITNGYANTTLSGGGICGNLLGPDTQATVTNCIIRDNVAQRHGGGIQAVDGLIDRCIVSGNSTVERNGGGLSGCNGTISNCLIYNNTATLNGGGMVMCNGDIVNCTIANNTAGVSGGGMAWCGSATITNCIIWGNNLEQVAGGAPTYSCIQDWSGGGTGNISTDPEFIDPNSNDYHLSVNSPCLNAGDPCYSASPGETDIDGQTRVLNGRVDIGADELFFTNPFIDTWPIELAFAAYEDGANPPDQILTIRNTGGGTLNWEINETCDWLIAKPTSGSSAGEPNDITISVDISGLTWGIYDCNLTVSDPCAMNSPQYANVTLDITGPIIELSSSEFVFDANVNGLNPDDQVFTVRNSGGGTLNWEITETCDWLQPSPTSGSSTGEPNDVTLSVDISGLSRGEYNCQLTVSDPCAMNSPQVVNVTFYVGGIIYVKQGGTGSGTSWADAYGELQDGLDNVFSGSQIWVAEGTYFPTSDYGLGIGSRGKHFRMINNVAIYGGFPDTGDPNMANRDPDVYEAILSGEIGSPDNSDNCYSIFCHPIGTNLDSTAILDGFTITGGYAFAIPSNGYYLDPNSKGGGMYNEGSSPTVTNCTFSENSAGDDGGGMFNWKSCPTVTNCTFSENSAGDDGGGMFNNNYSNPTVTNCTFTGNEARHGGGMSNRSSSPIVSNCTFTGNEARHGGGMANSVSSPIVNNCAFIGNTADYGNGGGMYNYKGSPTVTNCIFSCNSADVQGGGMKNRDCPLMLTNCIIWENSAPNGSQIHNHGSSSPTVTYCDVQSGYPGIGNIEGDPLFADPNGPDNVVGTQDDNWKLLPGSPCIDAGDSNSVPSDTIDLDDDGNTDEPIPWDLDGHNRFVDDPDTVDTGVGTPPIVDMGAYERGICGDADHPYPAGDMNSDCAVDITDAIILALAWLSEDGQARWNPACNLYEADSIINASDFAVLRAHWLECTKPECN